MSKNNKSKRTVEQGAEMVERHPDVQEIPAMNEKENKARKNDKARKLARGGF